MARLTLALDAMGGDHGPRVIVPAALQMLDLYREIALLLVGQPELITPWLKDAPTPLLERIALIPAMAVVGNDARIAQGIRASQGTSMRTALEQVQSGKAAACISAGNTGVLMGLSKMMLRLLPGIERPALVAAVPHANGGETLLLDLGANVGCSSTMLAQFAVMGSVMAEEFLQIPLPKVALLNIGVEASKGAESIHEAAAVLKGIPSINYIGYMEGNDLLTGKTDVLVCDGFSGNVMLKTLEGVTRQFIQLLRPASNSRQSGWLACLAGKIVQKEMRKRLRYFDPDQYNGAALLGLRSIVVKSHGSANANAFVAAIKQALQAVERGVPNRIASRLEAVLLKK